MTGLGQTYFAALFEDDVRESERGAETRRTHADDAHVDVLRDPLYARWVKRLSPARRCDMEGAPSEAYSPPRASPHGRTDFPNISRLEGGRYQGFATKLRFCDTTVALQCHVTPPTITQAAVPLADDDDRRWAGVGRVAGPVWARLPSLTVGFFGVVMLWSVTPPQRNSA